MRTCLRPSLLCFLVLLLFSDTSESIFFQYPKRALMSFLETLGGHKQPKPIHHYHMHYYHLPVPVIVPKSLPPPKIEIDLLHSSHDQLRSLSWASHDYRKTLDPEIILSSPHTESSWSSPLPDTWPDSSSLQQKSWAWDNNDLLEKDHAYKEAKSPGILLQVPLQQQIVFYQQPAKDKSSLLAILFKKLRRLNDALFHPEEDHTEQHDNKPHISNSLTYAPS